MVSSMTGFGKGTSYNGNMNVEVEIKSVNNRFLEISLKMPRTLQSKEYEVREIIRGRVKRGKLLVSIQFKKNGFEEGKPVLNKENLEYAVQFLKQVRKTANIKEKIGLSHILTFTDIFSEDTGDEVEQEFELVKNALNQAIDELLAMRGKEGGQLAADIRERIGIINSTVDRIEELSKGSAQEYYDKLKERAKQLFTDLSMYNERLELELALLVDKSDITEECVRLRSHTRFFLEALDSSQEAGRKLNFLCQEINREANTIGSKTMATEVSHLAVQIKEELERIREQIQNLE